jgi:hypothetical protein
MPLLNLLQGGLVVKLTDIKLPEFFTLAAMADRFNVVKARKAKKKSTPKQSRKKKQTLVDEIAALAAKLQQQS